MYKEFVAGINRHTEDKHTGTYFFLKHLLVKWVSLQLITLNFDLYLDNDSPFNVSW